MKEKDNEWRRVERLVLWGIMSVDGVTTFFAVQLHSYEKPHEVASLILRSAHDTRLLFSDLEVLDVIEIGQMSFVRACADISNVSPVIERLLSQGRTVISPSLKSYLLRKPNGKSGSVPGTAMHMVPLSGSNCRQTYRGPKKWEAQFAS